MMTIEKFEFFAHLSEKKKGLTVSGNLSSLRKLAKCAFPNFFLITFKSVHITYFAFSLPFLNTLFITYVLG